MNNPRETIVRVAAEWLGTRETSKNQFPGDAKIWAATSYPNGHENREPYCAAFVCHCVQEAARRNPVLSLPVPPREASVKGWTRWAVNTRAGVKVFGPNNSFYKPEPGDIVHFLPRLSHIGIVESYDADSKTVAVIEANTNAAGEREGDGVMRKKRLLSFCGEFFRISAKAAKV